jgi:DNA replication protein DnaC
MDGDPTELALTMLKSEDPSNLHPAGFDELMPKTLATATVDRLLHHAHICVTEGQSFRLAQATTGKGVTPLLS